MSKQLARRLLRVYLGENDRTGGQPNYELIVDAARDAGLAGATVLRGPLGFGASAQLHTAKILRLSTDLPVVVEIVDEVDAINRFIEAQSDLLSDALVTLEKVQVVNFE